MLGTIVRDAIVLAIGVPLLLLLFFLRAKRRRRDFYRSLNYSRPKQD